LGAHQREKRRRENGDVPGQLLGKGRGAGACPLTRERVTEAVGGGEKERAGINRKRASVSFSSSL
jgi:hypothetical protein